MHIQKFILALFCAVFLNACTYREARLYAVEEQLVNVEEKVDALLSHTNKTYDIIDDMDLRLEALEQDAKKRGVPVRIKGSDIAAAKLELMRQQNPGKKAETPTVNAFLSQQNNEDFTTPPSPNQNVGSITKQNLSQKIQRILPSPTPLTGSSTQVQQKPMSSTQVMPSTPMVSTVAPMPTANAKKSIVAPRTQISTHSPMPQSYDTAMNLYKTKQYEKAEQAFDAFLRANPEGVLAPNALYWKGESFYARANYPQAIFAFKEVQTRYPRNPKAPDALLKTAMSYAKLGDTENANLHYLVLKEDFPRSSAAKRIPQ